MGVALKRCPFCGGAAEIVHWRHGEDRITYTKCLGPCHAAGREIAHVGSTLDEAKGHAASAWNSRPREERLEGLLRKAAAYLRLEETDLAAGIVLKIDAALKEEHGSD